MPILDRIRRIANPFLGAWLILELISFPAALIVFLAGSDTLVDRFVIAKSALTLSAFFVLLVWVYTTAATAHRRGLRGDYDPFWCFAWYFIPIMGWFAPFSELRNLNAAVHGENAERARVGERLIAIWQIGFCAPFVIIVLLGAPVLLGGGVAVLAACVSLFQIVGLLAFRMFLNHVSAQLLDGEGSSPTVARQAAHSD